MRDLDGDGLAELRLKDDRFLYAYECYACSYAPPLILSVLGLSGAWIANLRALEPYQPLFILIAVGFIGAGFYLSYRQPKQACADGMACARPLPNKLVRSSLWLASLIVFAVITFGYWFPYLMPYLP